MFTPSKTQNNDETAIDIQLSNIDDKKHIGLNLEQKAEKSNDDDFHREFLKVLQDGQPRSTRRSINRTEFGFSARSPQSNANSFQKPKQLDQRIFSMTRTKEISKGHMLQMNSINNLINKCNLV